MSRFENDKILITEKIKFGWLQIALIGADELDYKFSVLLFIRLVKIRLKIVVFYFFQLVCTNLNSLQNPPELNF